MGGLVSMGVFLRDPSLIYASFGENHRKPPNFERLGRQTQPGIKSATSRLPLLKHRTAKPLVGAKTDSFNIHILPGICTRDLCCSSRLPQPLYHMVGFYLLDCIETLHYQRVSCFLRELKRQQMY